ncbi:MAG: mechanosensitive ion channel family protein, partial [Rhizobiaceae bacterium]|nr:mechanosensitive ion channel family protein [Rhizobiaceae bacterium]
MPFKTIRKLLALGVLIAAAAAPAVAWGQGAEGPGNRLVAEQRGVIEGFGVQVDGLERDIEENAENDPKLVETSLELEDIQGKVFESSVAFRPRLSEINARLEQLGPPPPEGETAEPDIVTRERQELRSEKAEINAVLGLAEQLTVRIHGLTEKISAMRSELFRTFLTRRYPLADTFDSALRLDVRAEFTALYRAFSSWLRFVYQFKFQAALAAACLALLAAVVLLVGGRRVFHRFFDADPAAMNPSYLSRLSVAFWSTLLPTAAVAMFLVSSLFFFDYYNVLRGDIGVFLRSLFEVVGVVFGVNRLARATLSPGRPNWRLIPVEAAPARRLVQLATAMAVVIGLNGFLA